MFCFQVKQSNAGEYWCYGSNGDNSTSKSVVLLVQVPPPNSLAFSKAPQDICVRKGNSAVFPCKVEIFCYLFF